MSNSFAAFLFGSAAPSSNFQRGVDYGRPGADLRVAQMSMPAPYFDSYFAWSGVSQYLHPMAGQPIRTAELQAALTEMADSMRVLADTASVNDTEAVPAIRFSLLLIGAMQMALASKWMPT
jgi:hypothetical protein